jgi:hypothetical protein
MKRGKPKQHYLRSNRLHSQYERAEELGNLDFDFLEDRESLPDESRSEESREQDVAQTHHWVTCELTRFCCCCSCSLGFHV